MRLLLMLCSFMMACGCSETRCSQIPDGGSRDGGPEARPASVTVTITNASQLPRTFNAGWGLNPDKDPNHPTGWLIPVEVLQPGETRNGTISAAEGDDVEIGVSGYWIPDPTAWARQDVRFILPAGSAACAFTYSIVADRGYMTASCAPD